jgi:glyoxylase-like metal-dependent hydrolase (beta-lactamase superfamily II)
MKLKVWVGTINSALLFLLASMPAGRSEESVVEAVPRHHNHPAKQTSVRRAPKGWNGAVQNTLVAPPDSRADVVPQTNPYSDALLPASRRAATIVPGDPPKSLHVLTFNRGKSPVSEAVENAPSDPIAVANVVFQILYSHGWIMVDAGMDRELIDAGDEFSQERYDRAQLALRDARMIVVTHEHDDHVAGVIRSPYLSEIERKTILNRAQVQTLLNHPNKPAIKLDRERAARYLVVDYDLLLPIAPGVVLIKAAGHTPGSQMVYVHLASGQELLLAGNVAWLMLGIEKRLQKPESASKRYGEDREAIRPQLEWLHGLAAQMEYNFQRLVTAQRYSRGQHDQFLLNRPGLGARTQEGATDDPFA